MKTLLLLQFASFISTAILVFMLVVSRIYVPVIDKQFEKSRKILIFAILLLCVHFVLQMLYGFRAQGDDVGAVINILFYAPVAFLISISQLLLFSNKHSLRKYYIISACGYLLIITTFIVGLLVYKSLHMQHAFYTMAVLYTLVVLYLLWNPYYIIKGIRSRIERETGNDVDNFSSHMRTGMVLLCSFSSITPVIIFSKQLLLVGGPLFFLALMTFVISFIALGYNLQPVAEVLHTAVESSDGVGLETTQSEEALSPERIKEIEDLISKWRENKGFCDSYVSMTTAARRIGISSSELSSYVSQQCGLTFRVWLSNIRIEESKRLLLSNSNYSMETIATECGFSSRSYFQTIFKKNTGLTPKAWLDAQKNC